MATLWESVELLKLKKALSHVLWIGGATDAGKTTMADMLAEKYRLQTYHGDRHWRENWSHVTPKHQPAMHAWDNMSMDGRWVHCSVESLTTLTLQIMDERLPLIIDNIVSMPQEPMIVAEWFGFLPDLIVPLLSSMNQALWMLHNDTFKQASIQQRGKSQFHTNTSDPEQAWDNHLRRDLKIAEMIRQQAERHGVHIIMNDGERNSHEVLTQVEAHFAPCLP